MMWDCCYAGICTCMVWVGGSPQDWGHSIGKFNHLNDCLLDWILFENLPCCVFQTLLWYFDDHFIFFPDLWMYDDQNDDRLVLFPFWGTQSFLYPLSVHDTVVSTCTCIQKRRFCVLLCFQKSKVVEMYWNNAVVSLLFFPLNGYFSICLCSFFIHLFLSDIIAELIYTWRRGWCRHSKLQHSLCNSMI